MKTTRSPKAKSYMPSRITKEAKKPRSYAETFGLPKPPFTTGRNAIRAWGWTSPATQRAGRGKQKAQKHVRRPGPWQQNAQGCAFKKVVRPGDRKNMAVYLMKSYPVSTTRACKVIDLPKSMFYYQSSKDDQPVIDKLNELVSMRVNHKAGQDKLYERIRSEGIPWNYKRVRRVYPTMGLKHRQRTKRRLPKRKKTP